MKKKDHLDLTRKKMIQTTTSEIIVPEGAELIDDVFYVWKTRFGLYSSMTMKGRKMMTGATKDSVIIMTRWHLKCEQEGTLEQYTRVVNSGVVGGKL